MNGKTKNTTMNIPKIQAQKNYKKAIKKIKNQKSCGPDEIPNEIFTKADNKTINIYKNLFNCIIRKQETPATMENGHNYKTIQRKR